MYHAGRRAIGQATPKSGSYVCRQAHLACDIIRPDGGYMEAVQGKRQGRRTPVIML
jgi:hypothetical protein